MKITDLFQLCPAQACKTDEGSGLDFRKMKYRGQCASGEHVFECPNCHGKKFFKKRFFGTGFKMTEHTYSPDLVFTKGA